MTTTNQPGRLTNQLSYIANEVLVPTLMMEECAKPFLVPVDPDLLGIPVRFVFQYEPCCLALMNVTFLFIYIQDYHQLISDPMDLGTINNRLRAKNYSTARDCLLDLVLIFENCHYYNGHRHPITLKSRQLEKIIGDKLILFPLVETDGVDNGMVLYFSKRDASSNYTKLNV